MDPPPNLGDAARSSTLRRLSRSPGSKQDVSVPPRPNFLDPVVARHSAHASSAQSARTNTSDTLTAGQVAATCTLTRSLADADASSTMTDEDLHLGIAGSSASRKADRLRQERERRKSERSPLGRAWASVFPSAEDRKRLADERHWRTGAEGEQNLAALLAKRCPAIPMLHDRAVPSSRANIDHIAIAPSGVYIIDCKRYKGKIEVAKPLFGEAKLKINGRDRTKLIDGLDRRVAHVKAALADISDDVPVHGCLCFVAPEGFLADVGLPVLRTLKVDGYPLYYPKRLAKPLNQQGPITADQAQRLQTELDRRLPPAIRRDDQAP